MKQIPVFIIFFIFSCATTQAQIYRVAQMNAEQIRALDKQKNVVILTGGILEEHGPHLPSFTDGFSNGLYGNVIRTGMMLNSTRGNVDELIAALDKGFALC